MMLADLVIESMCSLVRQQIDPDIQLHLNLDGAREQVDADLEKSVRATVQACAKLKAHTVAEARAVVMGALASSNFRIRFGQMKVERQNPKIHMRSVGTYMWDSSYALTEDDDEAFRSCCNWLARQAAIDPGVEAMASLMLTEEANEMMAAARWADQAFPVVQLAGHKYAAALLATRPGNDLDIRPPWKAFMIEVPSGIITFSNKQGDQVDCTHILLHVCTRQGIERWNVTALTSDHVMLWTHGKTLQYLLEREDWRMDDDACIAPLACTTDKQDERALALSVRLAVNVCLAMCNPSESRPVGKHPSGWVRGPGRESQEPTCRTFRVGRAVQVDCRPAIKDYLQGRRSSSPTVQFLVRGHFRNQACGPQLSDRRRIWIQPFWKGPDDRPINVRPHSVGDGA